MKNNSQPIEVVISGVCGNCGCHTESKTKIVINSDSDEIESGWNEWSDDDPRWNEED